MIVYLGRTELLRVTWLTRLESAIGLLSHDHRRAFWSVLEEWLCHSFRQANATVRSGIRWDIAFMHCVAAVEMHAIGHSRPIEMRARRPAVFAHVDVGSHRVPIIIDVITEFA